MDWFDYWLIFEQEQCVEIHEIICDGLAEATEFLDQLYLQLHQGGPIEDMNLDSGRRPSAIALSEHDAEEFLLYYELQWDVAGER